MAFGEFDLIDTYFTQRSTKRHDVAVGVGDDGAVVSLPEHSELVIVTDTMVADVHFDSDTPARAVGHKIIAVNLSDLAAMGAEPTWISLAITLPQVDHDWLEDFAVGLREICDYYGCQLIGGDTTQGPLSLTVTAHGVVPADSALKRSGARPGDWIYLSGPLGDAGLALAARQQKAKLTDEHYKRVTDRLYFPSPRVALGQSLRGIASSAIDISDGLAADLGHILKASGVGARVSLEAVPLSLPLTESVSQEQALTLALVSGDDYELCFTVPESRRGVFDTLIAHSPTKPICIGRINNESGKLKLELDGEPWELPDKSNGFQHFSERK
ncbi:thiamine-phosphate kinase [Pseudidiomarina sp.]|uniref:thiamine-phosphate kinase n=1 Tax=Pseudidiomarina sp. TaxID=2081707 RepID=UPI00299EC366|nr:thiamine-phosphate kinase [Pseudidiomarina sp.]MDX1705607.1 thiamine-phosphate kinase [Pseudidiomarina sp.]